MSLIEWKSEYLVNVEEIDIHHEELFNIYNRIYEDYSKADSVDCIGSKIDELIAFTDFHFSIEEQYMKDNGFSDIKSHIIIHRTFTDRIAELKLIDNRDDADITNELINYYGNWLIHHVIEEHKLFAKNN